MKISNVLAVLVHILSLTTYSLCCAKSLASACNSSIYADSKLSLVSEVFSIHEKVYLRINCSQLPMGAYRINTQWIDQNGMLQSERYTNLNVGFLKDYSVVFEFKQLPKGTLKRLLTNHDFDDFQYGQWSVLVFINTERIGRYSFNIED